MRAGHRTITVHTDIDSNAKGADSRQRAGMSYTNPKTRAVVAGIGRGNMPCIAQSLTRIATPAARGHCH